MTATDRLLVDFPPPPNVPAKGAAFWEAAERALGTPLPCDYRKIIDAYGDVGVSGGLWVYVPFSSMASLDIVAAASTVRRFVSNCPVLSDAGIGAYPEPSGLLPWATTDDGSMIAWETTGEPDDWRVALIERDGLEMERFDGGASEFLLALLRGQRFPTLFPEDYPERPELVWWAPGDAGDR